MLTADTPPSTPEPPPSSGDAILTTSDHAEASDAIQVAKDIEPKQSLARRVGIFLLPKALMAFQTGSNATVLPYLLAYYYQQVAIIPVLLLTAIPGF